MPTNSGNPVDSAGNLQVDFAWGNFPPQPNDVRTTVSDTTTAVSTTDPVFSSTNTNKRLVPGRDNHDAVLGGWGGYPFFSAGSKSGNFYQGDSGKFTGTGATASALANWAPFIVVPSVVGQTNENARDGLRDSGFANSVIQSNTTVAGGRIAVTAASRSGTVVSLTANAHGLQNGDVIAVYGLTSTVATLNGVYTVDSALAGWGANTITYTHPTSGAITNVAGLTNTYAVVVGKSVATTVNGALVAGVTSFVATSTSFVTAGMTVTGTGFATGTVVQYINGTTVGISLPTTAAISNGSAVTFATVPTNVTAIRTVAYSGSATAGTATITTVGNHGLNVGDSVSVINSTVLATTTGTVANASTALTVADATNIAASALVFGPGIALGTTVSGSPSGTSVTLSGNSTAALVAASVVTTGTATSGSTALTIPTGSGATAASLTANGHLVTGAGIPSGTYVSSGGGTTSITLSNPVDAALSGTPVTFSLAKLATGTAGASTVTVGNATSLLVGQTVTGSGILDGTIVTAISGTTITLSRPLLTNLSSARLTFSNLITFGTVATSKLNTAIASNVVGSVLVTAVPTSTSFQYALTGLTGAANISAAGDEFVATSASSTQGGYTLNVTAGDNNMIGAIVTGAGIPDGTFVTARATNALTISKALTADPGSTPLVFFPGSVIPGVRTNTVSAQSVAAGAAGITTAAVAGNNITLSVYN